MEYVTVKDPFATDEKEEKHPHMMHIFESNLPKTDNAVSDDINVY